MAMNEKSNELEQEGGALCCRVWSHSIALSARENMQYINFYRT